jgi:His-Xaa-Ser system protein HxsD
MIERELTFDRDGYSVDAIQRAAYRLSDGLSVDITVDERQVRCVVHMATDDIGDAETTLAAFRNEALDYVLRERIRAETEGVRNLILAAAFSGSDLIDGV